MIQKKFIKCRKQDFVKVENLHQYKLKPTYIFILCFGLYVSGVFTENFPKSHLKTACKNP